jgi:hypothetical protein
VGDEKCRRGAIQALFVKTTGASKRFLHKEDRVWSEENSKKVYHAPHPTRKK